MTKGGIVTKEDIIKKVSFKTGKSKMVIAEGLELMIEYLEERTLDPDVFAISINHIGTLYIKKGRFFKKALTKLAKSQLEDIETKPTKRARVALERWENFDDRVKEYHERHSFAHQLKKTFHVTAPLIYDVRKFLGLKVKDIQEIQNDYVLYGKEFEDNKVIYDKAAIFRKVVSGEA